MEVDTDTDEKENGFYAFYFLIFCCCLNNDKNNGKKLSSATLNRVELRFHNLFIAFIHRLLCISKHKRKKKIIN